MHTSAMHTGCHDVDDSLFLFSHCFFCTTTNPFNSNTCCGCSLIRATTPTVSHCPNAAQPVSLRPAIPKQHLAPVFSNFVDMALESARLFFRGFLSRCLFRQIGRFPQQLVTVSWWFKNAACPHRRNRKASEAKGTQLSFDQ